ncbi:MAG TPA: TonB-dependent receptor [Steroidobacteraceae bacterium]
METTRLPGLLRGCVLSFTLLVALACAPSAWASSKIKFDLHPDQFPKAILEFYHQSKVEVLFLSTDSLYKIHTQPVVGMLEPREALERMLNGTGLTYEFDTDHSVIIKQPQAPSAALPHPPPEPRTLKLSDHPKHPAAAEGAVPDFGPPSEVLVTGSLIRTAMDMTAPVVYLTHKDFSAAPYPTVQDALYQLPINSMSAPREDLFVNNNYNYGSGIDLRGLGVAATLVLVNGHRQTMSGLNGDFVDVSNIPMAAVDRIELLPDGASALYGSDAIAGVVNILLKDDFQGAETQVRYGGAPGGRDDVMASQLLGTHWGRGSLMLVYQYENGTTLAASARGYGANADKRPYGGSDYRSYFTDPGNILDPTTNLPVYGIPANLNGGPLTPSRLLSIPNFQNQFEPWQIFPQRTSHSLFARASQEVGTATELFAEGRFTQRRTYVQHFPEPETLVVPATNPFNPFGTDQVVAYNFGNLLGPITLGAQTRDYLGTVGAKFTFGADWQATLSESYGRETLRSDTFNIVNPFTLATTLADTNAATAFNPFGGTTNPTTLASIRSVDTLRAVSAIRTTSLVADGPLFGVPAGAVKLAAGLEAREETLGHTVPNIASPEHPGYDRYGRHVSSAFGELLVPIIGDPANLRAPPRLELNLAARYDRYSDFGHTLNPEVRVHWIPVEWLKWRASWGRSYRAPKLDDLYDSANNVSFVNAFTTDPKSPTHQSTILGIEGVNPKLGPETATTWTTGLDLVPTVDPGLKLSLTYYAIDYQGQITSPAAGNQLAVLVQENEWSPFIVRNPTQAQIAAVCNRPDLFGSRSACLASSPAAIVDFRLANLSSTKVTGLDLDVRQTLDSRVGRFDFAFNGNYTFYFDQAATGSTPPVNILDTVGNPLQLRFRATAGWSQYGDEDRGLGVNLAVNHTGGYNNLTSQRLPRINSLTTIDMQFRYGMPPGSGILSGTEFSLNAVNVFNQSPPFVDDMFGYDQTNFQGLGRVLSVSIVKTW